MHGSRDFIHAHKLHRRQQDGIVFASIVPTSTAARFSSANHVVPPMTKSRVDPSYYSVLAPVASTSTLPAVTVTSTTTTTTSSTVQATSTSASSAATTSESSLISSAPVPTSTASSAISSTASSAATSAAPLGVASMSGNLKAVSIASATLRASSSSVDGIAAAVASATSARATANPGVISAAVAWVSYTSASVASVQSSLSSASSQSRWLAGPSGSSARAMSSSAASASASVASARSRVAEHASFLAAVGSGVALPTDATSVWNPTATVARFVATDTAEAANESSSGDFFASLGKTPTSIALTSLTCVAIAAVVTAIIAFVLRRWCVRRKRRATRYEMFRDDEDEVHHAAEGSRHEDNDHWSARSVIRRHSEADAAILEGEFRGPMDMREAFVPYEMPRTPPRAVTSPVRRTLSNGSAHSAGIAGVGQAMGIANPSDVDSPSPLPYISWQPPTSLPLGAAGGMVAAPSIQAQQSFGSRFSSFSTEAHPADSGSEDPFSTPTQHSRMLPTIIAPSELDRTETGRSAWSASSMAANEADDDTSSETETVRSGGNHEDDWQADRVSLFRRKLSLATSGGLEASVTDALRARRASATTLPAGVAV